MSSPAAESPEYADIAARAQQEVGRTLAGRFRLDAVLGIGAMGVVYRARHTGLRKDVALKVLHRQLTANAEMVARFDREAAAASRLDHPNCVRVMDFGSTEDGRSFLVMEFLEGQDLADIVTRAMPPFRAVDLGLQVLAGLQHAHAQGLVHRDIKPENIFVIDVDGKEHVKLLDFGIAKIQHGDGSGQLTRAGMIFGTPHYMSPEQATGGVADPRTDLYAVGVVLYSMLSGSLPFDDEDPVALLRRQIREAPPPLPESVPGSLRNFVMRLLAKQPEERFNDAEAAIVGLKRAAAPTEKPIAPRRPQVTQVAVAPSVASVGEAPGLAPVAVELAVVAVAPAVAPQTVSVSPQLPVTAADPVAAPSQRSAAPSVRPAWLMPAVGAGALAIVALIAITWPSDEATPAATPPTTPTGADAADASTKPQPAVDEELGKDPEAPTPAQPDAPTEAKEDTSGRALRANLASIEALIESKSYDAARITIGPLLEVYEDEPILHWRMGQVLTRLNARVNGGAALESYRVALSLDRKLIDDEAFAGEFWVLLDEPKQREAAAVIAIDLLGDKGHARLAKWVNVQVTPMSYATRQLVVDHLRSAGAGKSVNEPLQIALDLWQAQDAERPCKSFAAALATANDDPDSFLWGTIANVPVPHRPDEGPCPGQVEALAAVKATYAESYAGIEPVVPAAFRRRSASKKSGNSSGGKKKRRR